MPRFHCPMPLTSGTLIELPASAARHVQVLRLQPGHTITLFDGQGGEFEANITHMGRSEVRVQVGTHDERECEATRAVHLAIGMPANERMDWWVEKATELGAASLQPLLAERSVLRLQGERAEKKRGHWQGIAIAACEQCGRNRVPAVGEVLGLAPWLRQPRTGLGLLLCLRPGAQPLVQVLQGRGPEPVTLLSGPEGGLSPAEEDAAIAQGFVPVTLGPRTLRAETAPLAALAALTLLP